MEFVAELKVLFAQKGSFTDERTGAMRPWANLQTLGDVNVSPDFAGLRPGKIPIVDTNGAPNVEAARQIIDLISKSKEHPTPIKLKLGQKIVDGNMALTCLGLG